MPAITFSDLPGKTVLVSITCHVPGENRTEQKQFAGVIIEASERHILVEEKNGERIPLPPDLSALQPARPGRYQSPITGEVIVNPDFLMSWSIRPRRPE